MSLNGSLDSAARPSLIVARGGVDAKRADEVSCAMFLVVSQAFRNPAPAGFFFFSRRLQ